MNEKTQKIIIGAGALYLLFGRYLATAYRLQFRVNGIFPISFTASDTFLKVMFSVKNPTSTPIYLRNFFGTVTFNGLPVAVTSTNINKDINANGITDFSLNIQVQNKNLASGLLEQIQSGIVDNWILKFSGKLGVFRKNLTIPFNMNFTYNDINF